MCGHLRIFLAPSFVVCVSLIGRREVSAASHDLSALVAVRRFVLPSAIVVVVPQPD